MHRHFLCLLALSACYPMLSAQETRKPDAPVIGITSPEENDKRIARWLIVDVRGIIDCSQEALTRSSNENVKNFAQTMLQDHKACLGRLEQVRGVADVKPRSESNAPVTRLENTTVQPEKSAVLTKDDGQTRNGKIMYRVADFLVVKEALCERMKETMMKEMKQLSAAEFDEMYMKHMVMSHEMMLASCDIIAPYAQGDLKTYLQQNNEKMKDHLAKAKALCSQVSGKKTAAK
jgi:predicted outer membrane protein